MKTIIYLLILSFSLLSANTSAQVFGCTDSKANNYNALASNNDGSCNYQLDTIAPTSSFLLDNIISETSGLILWNNSVWTHNDSGGETNIYALDTLDGNITQTVTLPGTYNYDWEEISQDDDFIYIGDFGNNVNGIRNDLKILRISKSSILINTPVIDSINFSYSNQTILLAEAANITDFDCEAFIVSSDSIYLFTKQWTSGKTSIYVLPKTPGTYVANLKATLDVQGLITGAVYLESKKLVALCGYSKTLKPFVYLLYDFTNTDFFSGNKRKLVLPLPYHQVEGITTSNGLKFYVSNEKMSQLNTLPKLHIFDLSIFLNHYLNPSSLAVNENELETKITVYPIPANDFVTLKSSTSYANENYFLMNQLGQIVLSGKLTSDRQQIDISNLSKGIYILRINSAKSSEKQIELQKNIKLIKN